MGVSPVSGHLGAGGVAEPVDAGDEADGLCGGGVSGFGLLDGLQHQLLA